MATHTPGPWFPHGFTYPEGVVGDVFAHDHTNVLACTPICRVVEPVSKMDSDLRRPPIDALRAVARKEAARPVIEANARLIAAAPELAKALAPFAAIAAVDIGDDEHDSDLVRPMKHNHAPNITVGMIREARAALQKAGVA
ncbi:hypothetical protein ABC347_07940 [Sphingomonas sp. 1P06PA]|uniref:hypothetical protein n=1 Tax=Sphingomonas sp. 1P06PA TaxID=554121 RepID=UPI0039A7034E